MSQTQNIVQNPASTGPVDPAPDAPLPTQPQAIMDRLADLGVAHTLYNHEAVFTVEESSKVCAAIPGVHCKNLFIRDKRENMYLIVCRHEARTDLKALAAVLGADKFSFGSPDRLWQYLGVRPGSVCPFSVINDTGGAVKVILDAIMMEGELVGYHPLVNTMTVTLPPQGLVRFLESCGHAPQVMTLPERAAEAA